MNNTRWQGTTTGRITTRLTRDEWAMAVVRETAKRATCMRRQVGCVLMDKDGHILSTGYNGVAAGRPHCNEFIPFIDESTTGCNLKYSQPTKDEIIKLNYPNACGGAISRSGTNLDACEAIHAEQNALLRCRDIREIHTAYISCSPCMTCAKLLSNTGCKRIVFGELYPNSSEVEIFWLSGGGEWILMSGVEK